MANRTIYVPDTGEGARVWIAACRRAQRLNISVSTLVLIALREQEMAAKAAISGQLKLPLAAPEGR